MRRGLCGRMTKLSDAGIRWHQSKLFYPNHRSSPWLTEAPTPRSRAGIISKSDFQAPLYSANFPAVASLAAAQA